MNGFTARCRRVSGAHFWVPALFFLLIIAFALFVKIRKPGITFWDDAVVGIASTVIALVIGIPAALFTDRLVKRGELSEEYSLARKREKDLLLLVKEELEFDKRGLALRTRDPSKLPREPLKSDFWDLATTGNRVSVIDDPVLLNRVTSAYYRLRIVARIEHQAYLAARSPTVTFGSGTTAFSKLVEDARSFDQVLGAHIDEALRAIDQRLPQL